MIVPDAGTSPDTTSSTTDTNELSQQEDSQQLKSLARKLQQTKRQLLLKSVEQPHDSIGQLRKLMLDLTMDSMDFDHVDRSPFGSLAGSIRRNRSVSDSSSE
jgi:hypothetical protein